MKYDNRSGFISGQRIEAYLERVLVCDVNRAEYRPLVLQSQRIGDGFVTLRPYINDLSNAGYVHSHATPYARFALLTDQRAHFVIGVRVQRAHLGGRSGESKSSFEFVERQARLALEPQKRSPFACEAYSQPFGEPMRNSVSTVSFDH